MNEQKANRDAVMLRIAEAHKANIMDFFMNLPVARHKISAAVLFFQIYGKDLLKRFISPADWKILNDELGKTANVKKLAVR